ncbi:hypothetical protein [Actibacterium sp. D379-3]
MSAPHTDPETEKKRHRPAIWGIRLSAVFGVVLIVWWLFEVAAGGNAPETPDARIDGRTGEQVETMPDSAPVDTR